MGWEVKRGHKYYVLVSEAGGKKKSKWFSGEAAKLAEEDHLRTLAEIRERRQEAEIHDAMVKVHESMVKAAADALLAPYGCIRDQGRWRKPLLSRLAMRPVEIKREAEDPFYSLRSIASPGSPDFFELVNGTGSQPSPSRGHAFVACPSQGTLSEEGARFARGVVEGRTLPHSKSGVSSAVGSGGDELQEQIRVTCLEYLAEGDAEALASLWEDSERWAADLKKDCRHEVEFLLCDLVVTCWLDSTMKSFQTMRYKPYEYGRVAYSFWDRRSHRAAGRLLRALERLGQVERMRLPS